jgi:transposase
MYVEPDYAYIHRELAKRGVTMTLLWEEYCQQCHESGQTPYQYTQFGEKHRRWARVTKVTMRIQHKPGDAMEVDWTGDTIPVFDPVMGEESAAYLFVAVLPCSGYIYAEACDDMKTENWLLCHVHAYNYFDGVTRLLIPDNLKTGVISNTRYDVVLNRSYQELAEHYGTAIVPTRVRKPRDKSHAESSVRFVETWIIATLRNQKFFSVQELNKAAAQKLEELNERPFKQRVGNRKSAYLNEEKAFMLPLPSSRFEPAVWIVAKVGTDYLISDNRNKYSVPSNLIGNRVDIRTTRDIVEVFYHGSRVAAHRRFQTAQHDPMVKPEHMPPEQRLKLSNLSLRLGACRGQGTCCRPLGRFCIGVAHVRQGSAEPPVWCGTRLLFRWQVSRQGGRFSPARWQEISVQVARSCRFLHSQFKFWDRPVQITLPGLESKSSADVPAWTKTSWSPPSPPG